MGYCFGVDAGGSTTICAIADMQGKLVSIGQSKSANYKLVGTEVSQQHIWESIERAAIRGNVKAADLQYGFYAVSGLDTEDDRNIIDRFIRTISPTKNYALDNDAIASLILGTREGYGVVLICGTGSNCVAVNQASERLQVGGLGREFGDFCGGREIAIQAMAAAVRGHDGRGPRTILYESIIQYLGLQSLADFAPILHYSVRSYPIANLVPLVFEAAERGDQVAIDILRYNGEELALSAQVAIGKLFGRDEDVEVVLTGGVFRHDKDRIVIGALQDKLSAKFPNVKYRMPAGEPVIGAVIQALRQSGLTVSQEHKEELIQGMEAFQDLISEFQVS